MSGLFLLPLSVIPPIICQMAKILQQLMTYVGKHVRLSDFKRAA